MPDGSLIPDIKSALADDAARKRREWDALFDHYWNLGKKPGPWVGFGEGKRSCSEVVE